MFSQAERGTPLCMEEQGDLCSGRDGTEGSGVCLHVRQVLAHRAQLFEPRGGRGLPMAGCKFPAGSRDGVGTPRATEGTRPLETYQENSLPRPLVHKSMLRTESCEAGSASGLCAPEEIAWSSEGQGRLLFPGTGAQGPCGTAVTSQGWVTRPLKGGARDLPRVGHVTPPRWDT